jgi:hypothetical protein
VRNPVPELFRELPFVTFSTTFMAFLNLRDR